MKRRPPLPAAVPSREVPGRGNREEKRNGGAGRTAARPLRNVHSASVGHTMLLVVALRLLLLSCKFVTQQVSYVVMSNAAYVLFNKVIFLDILTGTMWLPVCVRWWTESDDSLYVETVASFLVILIGVSIAFVAVVASSSGLSASHYTVPAAIAGFAIYLGARLFNTLNLTTYQIAGRFFFAYWSNIVVLAVELCVLLLVYFLGGGRFGLTRRLLLPGVPMVIVAYWMLKGKRSLRVMKLFSVRQYVGHLRRDAGRMIYFGVAAILIQSDRMIADYVTGNTGKLVGEYLLTFAFASAVYGISLSLVEHARTDFVEAHRAGAPVGRTRVLAAVGGLAAIFAGSILVGPFTITRTLRLLHVTMNVSYMVWVFINLGFFMHSLCALLEIQYMLGKYRWSILTVGLASVALVGLKVGMLIVLPGTIIALAVTHMVVAGMRLCLFYIGARPARGLAFEGP